MRKLIWIPILLSLVFFGCKEPCQSCGDCPPGIYLIDQDTAHITLCTEDYISKQAFIDQITLIEEWGCECTQVK